MLAIDRPKAIGREKLVIQETAQFTARACAAMAQFIGPDMFLVIGLGVNRRASLEHYDIEPTFREDLRSCTSCCSRTDDANVVNLGRTGHLCHEAFLQAQVITSKSKILQIGIAGLDAVEWRLWVIVLDNVML